MPQQIKQGNGVPLALKRAEAQSRGTLRVRSNSIRGVIPAMHSGYADGVSPEISWSKVEGAKSYALILEDPDAHAVRPFVHWVAWNIPGDATTLPEGLQDDGALTEPKGLLQGRTSRGSVGYFGPRPPEGDPPHHYHFQVFALDKQLDVPQGADRDQVLRAMSGHVLAAGELVGTYQQGEGSSEPKQMIGAEGTEAPGEPPRSGDAHKRPPQEELDAALANTFPASDPVSTFTGETNRSKR